MRFRLRTVFVIVVCVAIGCALLFTTPSYITVPSLIFLTVAIPAGLTAGTIYTRGFLRAFCIGGLFPSILMLYMMGWMFAYKQSDETDRFTSIASWTELCEDIDLTFRVYGAATWAMIVVVGIVVVAVRYFAHEGE